MEIGIAVGSLVLTPIVGEIKERIKSTLEKKLSKTLKGKLQDLERKMEAIHSELLSVESSRGHLAYHKWQQRIKEVISDAEDLLDDLEIQELRSGRTSGKVRHRTPKSSGSTKPVSYAKGVVKESLGGLNKLLESIEKAVANEKWTDRDSNMEFEGEKLIGRKDEITIIVRFLLSDNYNDNNNTCSIVGIGGVGKTALAQEICQHKRVNKKLVMKWACVGFKKFDFRQILVRIGGNVEANYTEQRQIEFLENSLREKRCLFILDDLWDMNRNEWKKLKGLLLKINEGNKILITTRNQRTAEIAAKDKTVFLKPLRPDECLPLIREYSENKIDSLPTPIKKELIEECEGVPLAALTLGHESSEDKLSKEDIKEECEGVPLAAITLGIKLSEGTIRGRDIWSTEDVEEQGNNIMNSLKFSYDHLKLKYKDCFAYHVVCNDILHKERLAQMWTAQGFIEEPDDGNIVFEKLQNASFFHDVEEHIIPGTQFKVLKLFRSLIPLISEEYAYTTKSRITGGSRSTRHVSLSPKFPAQIGQEPCLNEKLRTVVGPHGIVSLSKFRGLRVLVLFGEESESSAISLGNLKYLRYLDLSENRNLEVLPKSLGELLLLRTLRVDKCEKLKGLLPNDINKVTKLRYLHARKMSYFTKLETLEILDCPCFSFLETDMENLKNLKRLAIIKHPGLINLTEGLSSLTSLEMLTIEDCPRFEMSSTVGGRNILPRSLKSLRINRCDELTKRFKREEDSNDVSWINEVYLNGVLLSSPVTNVDPATPSASSEETGVRTEGSNGGTTESAREETSATNGDGEGSSTRPHQSDRNSIGKVVRGAWSKVIINGRSVQNGFSNMKRKRKIE